MDLDSLPCALRHRDLLVRCGGRVCETCVCVGPCLCLCVQLLGLQGSLPSVAGTTELPATHPFGAASIPLVSALQVCVAACPAGVGHQLVQSICMELVLLYGSHCVPGLEGPHTQVRLPAAVDHLRRVSAWCALFLVECVAS